jgi:hypothetical protein
MKLIILLVFVMLIPVFQSDLFRRVLARVKSLIWILLFIVGILPFLLAFGCLVLLWNGLSRLARLLWRPFTRRAKLARLAYLRGFGLPAPCLERLRLAYPTLNMANCAAVEQGLQQFFIACVHAGRQPLAMPSAVVGQLWLEWSAMPQYHDFCQQAFGRHLPYRAREWQIHYRANPSLQRCWHFACLQEQIKPDAPQRLPRLFALDAELNIEGGLHYVLTPQQLSHLRQQMATGSRGSTDSAPLAGSEPKSDKRPAMITALMLLSVSSLAMAAPELGPSGWMVDYFAWIRQTFFSKIRQHPNSDSHADDVADALSELDDDTMLDGLADACSQSSATPDFDWSDLLDLFGFFDF